MKQVTSLTLKERSGLLPGLFKRFWYLVGCISSDMFRKNISNCSFQKSILLKFLTIVDEIMEFGQNSPAVQITCLH